MTVLAERIYGEILDLPIEERLGLIDKLVQSITPEPQEIRRAWAEEAEHRYAAYKNGQAIPVPGEDVFKRINDRLNP
jgi:putative addiction module component (TIGR02574 family)